MVLQRVRLGWVRLDCVAPTLTLQPRWLAACYQGRGGGKVRLGSATFWYAPVMRDGGGGKPYLTQANLYGPLY
jgi:hypothetical protein